jgi:acid phosphatase family membrane protein YuiD
MSDPTGAPHEGAKRTTVKTRGAVTGHNVRHVLAFGLVGVIVAFIIVALFFGSLP